MRNFTSNIDDDDILMSRDNRNSGINRPDIDPGMEDDEDTWGDLSDDDSGWGSSFGGDSVRNSFGDPMRSSFDSMRPGMGGSGMGGMPGMSGFSSQYGTPSASQKVETEDDKIFSVIVKIFTGFISFLKDLITSFSSFTLNRKISFSANLLYSSIGFIILGILGIVFKKVELLNFFRAGLLGIVIGGPMFLFLFGKREETDNEEIEDVEEDNDRFEEYVEFNDSKDDFEDVPEDDSDDFLNNNSFIGFDTDIEEDSMDNMFGVKSESFMEPIKNQPGINYEGNIEKPENTDSIVKNLDVNNGMMTRQYLYEKLMDSMESIKKDFNSSVVYSEDSHDFLAFCSIVEKAAKVVMGGEKELPNVIKVEDKLFYTLLIVDKPTWLKGATIKSFVDEVVNICAFNAEECKIDENVSAESFTVGSDLYIKIMKGETAMVTIKDTYSVVKDKILNLKNKIPVVLGINAEGNVVFTDFEDINSFLISGAPRTGKSWCVKSLMAQMMMFSKPSEIQFYVMDAKELTSDFYTLSTPHIRDFISEDDKIIKTLEYFVNVESKRREKLLYDTGKYKNIKDFKRDNSEVELPYIYIVIDEILTISKRMAAKDPDTVKYFQSLLLQFTTRLPNLGLRLMIVPHLVKNDVVGKSITDMMPNRACVLGTPDDLDKIFGIKQKEFPQKLVHKGDMAVQFEGDKAKFVHSVIVSSTNEGYDDFFKFLTNLWLKIEPDSFKGSKLEKDIKRGTRSKEEFYILENMDLSYLEATEEPKMKKYIDIDDLDEEDFLKEDSEEKVEPKKKSRGRPRKKVQ